MAYVRPKWAQWPANRPTRPSESLRERLGMARFFEISGRGAFDQHFFNGLLNIVVWVSRVQLKTTQCVASA